MSYKRVVKKKGKIYGPYVYESYRDGEGKVKKRYLGKFKEKSIHPIKLMFLLGLLSFALIMVSSYTTNSLATGESIYGSFLPKVFEGFNILTGLVVGEEQASEESSNEKVEEESNDLSGEIEKESIGEVFLENEGEVFEEVTENFPEEVIKENLVDKVTENVSFEKKEKEEGGKRKGIKE